MEEKLTDLLPETASESLQLAKSETNNSSEEYWIDPMDSDGGYADCCGASEAEPSCQYRPPTEAEVAKYRQKREELA